MKYLQRSYSNNNDQKQKMRWNEVKWMISVNLKLRKKRGFLILGLWSIIFEYFMAGINQKMVLIALSWLIWQW